MKKYITILFLTVLIIPSVTFASWWNPFTWKIFKKREPVPVVVEKTNPTTPEQTSNNKVEELQKEIADLKKQVTNSSTTTKVTTNNTTSTTQQTNTQSAVQKPKIIVLPSGAVLDENGNIIVPAPTTNTITTPTPAQIIVEPTPAPVAVKPTLSIYQSESSYEPDGYWYISFNLQNKSDTDIGVYSINYSVTGITGLVDSDTQKMAVTIGGVSSPEESIGINKENYSKYFSPNIIIPAKESRILKFKYKPSYTNMEWNKTSVEIRLNSIVTNPISSISLPISNKATATH